MRSGIRAYGEKWAHVRDVWGLELVELANEVAVGEV